MTEKEKEKLIQDDGYTKSDSVLSAEEDLASHLLKKPVQSESKWQNQLDDVINKILNREKFSYDLNGDARYQQYKDKYIKQGKLAMGDAIGQASSMTGGYSNSYAQSVGQQAYQAQLDNLNDIVPELYQMAYDKYKQEGQDLYNQYSMLGAQEEQDYGRYKDSVSDWLSERDYLVNRYRDAISDEQWQKQFDAVYGNKTETTPIGDESTGESYNNGSLSSSQIKALQKALGVEADGMYGSASKKAAGGLSAEEAYKKFVGDQSGGGNNFTGKTYDEATAFMESHGVPAGNVSGLMTASEWNRRKSSYQAFGTGGTEVKNYKSYQEYLADYVEYAIETYGK